MALQNLRKYYIESSKEDFENLLNLNCLVTEKIQASNFHVRRKNGLLEYYKSGNKEPINKVDRTIVSYYEKGIKHFESILNEKIAEMPHDWKFGFDYMVNEKTVDIEYDTTPTNSLILNHIQVLSEDGKVKKVIRDPLILEKWSKILEVDSPEVIFSGTLNDHQKEKLVNLLYVNNENAKKYFEEFSFTYRSIRVFNEHLHRTTLNNDLTKEIDGLIITFQEGKSLKNFKIQTPVLKEQKEERKSSDAYQIAVVKLIEYFKQFDFEGISLEDKKTDERYIELMCAGFNGFIKENEESFKGLDFNSAEFATGIEFDLNPVYINNQQTIKNINDSKEVAELYKITLGTFRKEKQKPSDVFTLDLLNTFNGIVEKINNKVFANKEESDVMDFGQFKMNDTLKGQPSPILEGLSVRHKEKGAMPVNMFVGRFQPFTLGHAKVIEHLHKQNGLPTIIFLVKSKTKKKEDAFKRPFDESLQVSMIKKVMKEYPIENVFVINTGAIDKMFNELRPKYEPVLWGTGSDRLKTYGFQVNNPKYREDLGVDDDFRLEEIPRTDDNISATKVRNSLLDGEELVYRSMVPKSMYGMFRILKTELEQSVGALEESVLTFSEFKK
jgi:cytidyltransferase-like protein